MAPPTAQPVGTYLYRCTEDKLEQHLQRIADAGDTVEHAIFKGGRDYVLVVRRGGPEPPTVRLDEDSVQRLATELATEMQRGVRRSADLRIG